MPHKQRLTIQSILKQRQQEAFVGREDFLGAFHGLLAQAWDDPKRIFILNYYGQGGVGKTTLLSRLRHLANNNRAFTGWTDDKETDVPSVMAQLATTLSPTSYSNTFKAFFDQYNLFRAKKHELESDPDSPQGFAAFMTEKATQLAVHAGRRVPVAGVLFDLIDEDDFSERAGRWTTFVTRKLKNRHEVNLVLNPIASLTPLFLAELNELTQDRAVILFFDTYEQTASFLDDWLHNLLNGEYGDLPINVTFVIAGRDALNQDRWLPYEPILLRQSVEPFSEYEARDFLSHKGITDELVVDTILDISGRFPLLLATLASESSNERINIGSSSATAIERFLKWVPDQARRSAALNGALPQFLNRDLLSVVVQSNGIVDIFDWLKKMPFVQDRGDHWIYHETVRTQMLHHKRRESPQEWEKLHRSLADYFQQRRDGLKLDVGVAQRNASWQIFELGYRYHKLCQSPQESFPEVLNRFLNALKENFDFAERWSVMILNAGRDSNSNELIRWGTLLTEGLHAYRKDAYIETIAMFQKILEFPPLEAHPKAIALSWLGQLSRLQNNFAEALLCLNQALELYPTYAYATGLRGETYRVMRRTAEAIADYTIAIELDMSLDWAWRGRGQCYRIIKKYDLAIQDMNQALMLDPQSAWTYAQRGVTYLWMGNNGQGLSDLDKAIALKPDYAWALSNRGEYYSSQGKFVRAISDISRAIELEPQNASYMTRRGMLFRRQGKYLAAMQDFNKALELNEDYFFAFGQRGDLFSRLGDYERATADFTKALVAEPTLSWAFVGRGKLRFKLQMYKDALDDFTEALNQLPDDSKALMWRGSAYRHLGEYESAFRDFAHSLKLTPDAYRIWYQRGLTHKLLGNTENSVSDLQQAVRLLHEVELKSDDDWDALLGLVICHLALDENQVAISYYRKVVLDLTLLPELETILHALDEYLSYFPTSKQAQVVRGGIQVAIKQKIQHQP